MTLFLASVNGYDEAEVALANGADIIDLKDAASGALGALPPEVVRATTMAATGVDYIKVGLFADAKREDCIRALAGLARTVKVVGVMFADRGPDNALLPVMAEAGFAGAMLDTAGKRQGRLIDHMDIAALRDFVGAARAHDLFTGLAGSLETPDIPRLLLLEPDYLGFRGALCVGRERADAIDAHAVAIVRGLVPLDPRSPLQQDLSAPKVDYRLLAARGYSVEPGKDTPTDRIFVRDFVLPVRIGAYAHEREKPQRACFNVEVNVFRPGHAVEDMRDVFSYDVVTDGIRVMVAREHFDFVETLAERIAALILSHPRVATVTVRVEKLEIGPGGVGVEITRERPADIAKVHHLYPAAAGESD